MAHDHALASDVTAHSGAGFEVAVLLGRGMPYGEQRRSLPDLGEALVAQGRIPRFRVAYAEMSEPPLETVLAELAAEGVGSVVILPVIIPFDRNLKGWIGRWLSRWSAETLGRMRVVLADPVDTSEALVAPLVAMLDAAGETPDIREAARPLKIKAGASKIPDVARMTMVCLGPRCAQAGGFQIYDQLRDRFSHTAGIDSEDDEVLVIRTNCQGPCNFAPLIAVQPDNIWYGALTVPAINQIIVRHIAQGGEPVAPWALHPGERLKRPDGELAEPDQPFAAATAGEIAISGVFMRNAMSEDKALAAFMEVANLGVEDDRLIGVACAASPRIAIHDASDDHHHDHHHSHAEPLVHFHSHDHDELRHGEGIPLNVPARSRVTLQPGRLHMMLLDLKELPDPGTQMPLTLEFEKAGRVDLTVYIHAPG